MLSRIGLGVLGAVAFAGAALVACSSFSGSAAIAIGSDGEAGSPGSSESGTADGAMVVDAGDGGDGGDGAVDPCSDQDGGFEYAGLYVVDGTDETNQTQPASSMYRAPLYCDGTMGTFASVEDPPIRSSYYGAGLVVGGMPVVLSGVGTNTQDLVGYEFVGQALGGGRINFVNTAPTLPQPVWRFAAAATGSFAYVIGGRNQGGTIVSDVTQLTLSYAPGPTFTATPRGPLPEALERGSAAIARDKLVVYGGTGGVYWTTLAPDGSYTVWTAISNDGVGLNLQQDGMAFSDGDNVYLLAGERFDTAFNVLDCTVTPPVVHSGGSSNGFPSGVGVRSRGTYYVLPTGNAAFFVGTPSSGNALTFNGGSSIPAIRTYPSMFVF